MKLSDYDPSVSGVKIAPMISAPLVASIGKNSSLAAAGVDIGSAQRIGIMMPAAWTTAGLTFQVCDTIGGTYSNLMDATGVEVAVPVAASGAYTISNTTQELLSPWRFVKVRSGTAAVPVSQDDVRSITFVTK